MQGGYLRKAVNELKKQTANLLSVFNVGVDGYLPNNTVRAASVAGSTVCP